MINTIRVLLWAVLIFSLFSASIYGQTGDTNGKATTFNAELAKQLGADQYGMKLYVFVVLKTGPEDARITKKAERDAIFDGHFSNMGRLAKEGKLVLAGPLIDGKPNRGVYIFNVRSLEDAEALVKTDPAVNAGIFVYEMTKLYASAALMKVGEIHNTLQMESIVD